MNIHSRQAVAAAFGLVFLAGCGGGSNTASPAAAPAPAPVAPAPAPAPAPAAPAPAPAPAPASVPARVCVPARGIGTNGLSLNGPVSYELSDTRAGGVVGASLSWGVRYGNANLGPQSYTGSLRVRLFAFSDSHVGGDFPSGVEVARAAPNFVGAGARSSTQIFNGYTFSNIFSSVSGQNPEVGEYCLSLLLEHYSDSCSATSGYCVVDWVSFSNAVRFTR